MFLTTAKHQPSSGEAGSSYRFDARHTGYGKAVSDIEPTSETAEPDPPAGIAEPEALIDGAEDKADLGSRLSAAASDPPASWAGPDVPPANKQRSAGLSPSDLGTPASTTNPEPERPLTPMPENDLEERIHGLETAQAVQTATQAGAEATQSAAMAGMTATQAAAHAGTWATMAAGAAGLVVGIFLGLAIGAARRATI